MVRHAIEMHAKTGTGLSLWVRYEGGRQPGTVRNIVPLSFEPRGHGVTIAVKPLYTDRATSDCHTYHLWRISEARWVQFE